MMHEHNIEDWKQNEEKLVRETLRELEFHIVLEKIAKYCRTESGKAIILDSMPAQELFWLRNEHEMTGEMTRLLTEDDELPLDGITDIKQKLHKSMIENAVLSSTEALIVFDAIRISRLLKTYFFSRSEKYPLLADTASFLHENRILEKHINEAIDETGAVRDNATRELQQIRRSIFEKSQSLRIRLKKILKQVNDEDIAQEDFVTMREGRFVLPVKSEHKRHIHGIIHGVSQTGATVFLEPSEIIEKNNEISLLLNEEKREIYKILSNLTKEIGAEAGEFLRSVDIISHIDSIVAKARYSLEYGGVKPKISEENMVYLANIRHPLLVHSKGRKNVVPLSIDFDLNKRGHLISGPNAGGKTVALKSIGLNLAMALSGIFPLGDCVTNIRTIFSYIGDHQSIENDLSTFSSQIIKLNKIVSECGKDSLVLIDEIGSGTDPQEGSALAAAILDSFIERKAFFVATTHQSSLKSYALTKEVIENASLEFDDKRLVPTYNFLSGVPGNSYAFVLAESLGLPKHIIERARTYIGRKQTELEESIAVLQKYKAEAERFHNEAKSEKLKAEQARLQYEEKFREIKDKRSKLMENARNEANEILAGANKMIENAIAEIKEQNRPIADIKKEYEIRRKEIEEIARKLDEKQKTETKKSFAVGDSVAMENTSNIGTIIEIDSGGKSALVDFGGMKFRTKLDQLHFSDAQPEKKSNSIDYRQYGAKSQLDLRGMRAVEAIQEMETYISDALLGNIGFLNIIHGKGTGALRKVVHDFLREHPSVSSFRLGTLEEGGDGVTIVDF